MKHLKLFFACLLIAVLSIGQVWAEQANFAWSGSQNATTKAITWTSANICTIVQEQNGAQTAPNSSYISAPRWYKDNKITITAGSSVATFTSIVITATSESYATALANSTYACTGGTGLVSAAASGTAVTISCNGTVTEFTIVMGGQSRLSNSTTPTINYTASGGSNNPTVSFAPFLPDPIGSIPILSRAILASSYTLYILRIYPVIFLPLLDPRLQFSVFFGHF